ncbi:MAG: hypothetical protein ABIR37_04685 [Candidatus Saccharimonadales bacterium]
MVFLVLMSYEKSGSLISFNQPGEICGGGTELTSCETVKKLAKSAMNVELSQDSSLGDAWVGTGTTDIECTDCTKSCGVAVRFVDKRPTEELCFTFTDRTSPEYIRDYINTRSDIVESEG